MASGGPYIHTIRSHLASREYVRSSQTCVRSSQTCMRSSQQKFVTLALRTCRKALRATRKVFFAAYCTYIWCKLYTCECITLI